MIRLVPSLILGMVLLFSACAESGGDSFDASVETAVAATVISQFDTNQRTASSGPPQTVISCPDCLLVEVTGVVDGDTIDTTIGRVRFFGVVTPERGEVCSAEATEFTRLLVGSRVRLEDGPRQEDGFGRRLAYVFDPTGNNIDAQLITGGFGKAWTVDGQHRDVLVMLEQSARSNLAGCLWAQEKPATVANDAQVAQADPGRLIFKEANSEADVWYWAELPCVHLTKVSVVRLFVIGVIENACDKVFTDAAVAISLINSSVALDVDRAYSELGELLPGQLQTFVFSIRSWEVGEQNPRYDQVDIRVVGALVETPMVSTRWNRDIIGEVIGMPTQGEIVFTVLNRPITSIRLVHITGFDIDGNPVVYGWVRPQPETRSISHPFWFPDFDDEGAPPVEWRINLFERAD